MPGKDCRECLLTCEPTYQGGGLSSSAAMVVASAIATLQAYNALAETTQGQLAEIAIESGKFAYSDAPRE